MKMTMKWLYLPLSYLVNFFLIRHIAAGMEALEGVEFQHDFLAFMWLLSPVSVWVSLCFEFMWQLGTLTTYLAPWFG